MKVRVMKNSFIVCALLIAVISSASVFAADVVVQQGDVNAVAGTGYFDELVVDTNALVVDSNGNTGIGTASPSKKLEVNGNTKINGDLEVTGDCNFTTGAAAFFGSWTNKDSQSNTLAQNNVYKAGSDGFVCVRTAALGVTGGYIAGYTDGSNPPTTLRSYCVTGAVYGTHPVLNFTMPVKKDDYWKVTEGGDGTPTILWIPIGNGDCVKQ